MYCLFPEPRNVQSAPVITPTSQITVKIGEENKLFRQVCDILDKALEEWDSKVSDFDKDNNSSTDTILLNLPFYLSERIIYGKRVGEARYWEGDINLWPGDTGVVKLRPKYGEPCFYGVWIGTIDEFWDCADGVHIFYGVDKKVYGHPGSSWGHLEGKWEVFPVKGGWNPRDFSSKNELDHFEFRKRQI